MVSPSRRSLHQHFNRDHFILMYEITAKMASLEEGSGDLGSKQLADLVAPITDVDTTARQVFQSKTNFPYTETPILPPEVYRKGLSSREKLRELPGMDPILLSKHQIFGQIFGGDACSVCGARQRSLGDQTLAPLQCKPHAATLGSHRQAAKCFRNTHTGISEVSSQPAVNLCERKGIPRQ